MADSGERLEVRYIQRNLYAHREAGPARDFVLRRESIPMTALSRDVAMDMLQEKLTDPRHSGQRGNPKPDAILFFDREGREVLAVSARDVWGRLRPAGVQKAGAQKAGEP
jgi:hypothetical protein